MNISIIDQTILDLRKKSKWEQNKVFLDGFIQLIGIFKSDIATLTTRGAVRALVDFVRRQITGNGENIVHTYVKWKFRFQTTDFDIKQTETDTKQTETDRKQKLQPSDRLLISLFDQFITEILHKTHVEKQTDLLCSFIRNSLQKWQIVDKKLNYILMLVKGVFCRLTQPNCQKPDKTFDEITTTGTFLHKNIKDGSSLNTFIRKYKNHEMLYLLVKFLLDHTYTDPDFRRDIQRLLIYFKQYIVTNMDENEKKTIKLLFQFEINRKVDALAELNTEFQAWWQRTYVEDKVQLSWNDRIRDLKTLGQYLDWEIN